MRVGRTRLVLRRPRADTVYEMKMDPWRRMRAERGTGIHKQELCSSHSCSHKPTALPRRTSTSLLLLNRQEGGRMIAMKMEENEGRKR